MKVSNVRIMYTGDKPAECDVMVLSLCTSHLLAGATIQPAQSYLWVGGQLTKKDTYVISGSTRPNLVSKISELIEGFEAEVVSVSTHDTEDTKFIKWFESHL